MELDALPGGDPQRAVGPAFGDPVEAEILLRREPPARNAHPDHELPDLVVAALLALGRAVAIIALVDAVKFEQRIAFLVERDAGVRQVAGDVAAQVAALLLDRLGFGNIFDLSHVALGCEAGICSLWMGFS